MPVTKTAKRALRSSKNKEVVNKLTISRLQVAIRNAKKSKDSAAIVKATSLADRAAKTKIIHKNRAARIKSQLSKLLSKDTPTVKNGASKAKLSKKSKTTKK